VLVDDEVSFRTSLAEMLRDDGHVVRDYATPSELPALPSVGDVAVLLTDYDMPGQNGLDLADEFHVCHPTIPVIVLTAYRFGALEAKVQARSFMQLVQKPIDYVALHALIHEAATNGASL
jgi:two-component system nitrogen regulation response regulator GlnG